MRIKIRDWDINFEQDRSRQWKHLRWVPIPNKQGSGYRKIMNQKNGLEIFACWIAIVQQGSLVFPRGDLSKYLLNDLSLLTLISEYKIKEAIIFLSQSLDWIEVIENLDTHVKNLDTHGMRTAVGSSILCSSVQFNSLNPELDTKIKDVIDYLNLKTDSSFSPKTQKTISAINARISEGFHFEDFQKVIDSKTEEWKDDPKYSKYLCPDTLFRPSNFEKYLQAAKRAEAE